MSSGLSKGAKVLLMICPRLGDTGDVWEVRCGGEERGRGDGHFVVEKGNRWYLIHATPWRNGEREMTLSCVYRLRLRGWPIVFLPFTIHDAPWWFHHFDFAPNKVAAKRPDQYGRKGHEALEVAPAGVPYLPSWRMERRYVTGGFLLDPPPAKPSQADATLFGIEPREVERIEREAAVGGAGVSEYGSGAPLPEAMQEELILNDLLYALMGIPGR